MKVGSLAEVIKTNSNGEYKKGDVDVVSVIIKCNCDVHIGLEKSYDPSYTTWFCGCGYKTNTVYTTATIEHFREIQFPDDLQEQITEALTRELVTI